uniref:KIB1-4 beta-propeller domain-containing protein n=1 Tax=Aegilops tauschii subsp. strangulata TaxID=200361 RepID=A0A453HTQ7_AEGTS
MVCPHGCGVIDPRFHLRRWMMLPEGHGLYPSHASLRGYIHFFNLDTGKFVRVKLPVFNDHCVLDSAEGLLVMQRDEDTAIRLFHPFTGDVVDLPPLVTLVPHINPDLPGAFHPMQKFHYLRGVCAAFSVSATGAITIMLALHRMGCVAFATPRDQ